VLLAATEEFQCERLDTGAQCAVIGKRQADAYLVSIGKEIQLAAVTSAIRIGLR